MEDFKNILYPVALADTSVRVVSYVATMAKKFDAQVHLLHVLRRFDWFVNTYVVESPTPDIKRIASDFEDQILHQAQQKIEAFKKQYLKDVVVVKSSVVSGTHYKEILDYVNSEEIDLIIMGSGSTAQKIMFGSVASKVSRMSDVPVMLVKGN
jgi:nucleotide-binding universal stress UspA family protein